MPLVFGAVSSDTVDVADSPSIRSLDPYAQFLIVKPTSLNNNLTMMAKGTAAGNSRRVISLTGTSGNLLVTVDRATTDTSYTTSNTPFVTLNVWYALLVTYSSTATPAVHVYTARLGNRLYEELFSASQNGSGALGDDSATTLCIGSTAGHGNSFPGSIAFAAYFNTIPSLNEFQPSNGAFPPRDWQRIARMRGCVGAWRLGSNGLGLVYDESAHGNHGVITGATLNHDFYGNDLFRRQQRPDYAMRGSLGGPFPHHLGRAMAGGMSLSRGWAA